MKRSNLSIFICILLSLIIINNPLQGIVNEQFIKALEKTNDISILDFSETIEFSFSFPDPFINIVESDQITYTVLEIHNLSNAQNPEKPQLPMKNINVLLPPNTGLKDILVHTIEDEINLSHKIFPCGKPMTIGDIPTNMLVRNQESLYDTIDCYPENRVQQISIQRWRGYSLLMLKIYPIQYYPNQNMIRYAKNIHLSVILEYNEQDQSLLRELLVDQQRIQEMVENPSMVSTYELLSPNQKTSGNYKEYNYLIITSDELAPSFQPLLDYKSQYISSTMISLSTVESDFTGVDLQEKIRECIRYYYQNHQTEFVLLGGDVDIIPYRGLWGEAIDHEGTLLHDNAIPSDLYYACLDDTWDLDNDGIYGENSFNSTGEEADFFAEVYVGRAPVETANEVDIFLNKIITYETTEKPEGVALHQSGINMNNNPDSSVIPERCGQWIPENYSIKKLYQTDLLTHDEAAWKRLFDKNQFMIIEHTGNGVQDRYFITWPNHIFYNSDCQRLINQFYPIHTSVACDSGAFEYEDCLAENMVLQAFGGTSACLFNSRRGFTSSTDAHRYSGEIIEQQFYHIFQEKVEHIGMVNQYAKEIFSSDAMVNPAYRWCFYCINLLGDPEMPLFGKRESHILQNTWYVDDDFNPATPGWNITHFNTIQAGINAASSWDTVFIYNGFYQEAVCINKKILVTGEETRNTILLTSENEPVVTIQENHVTLINLSIFGNSLNDFSKGILCKNQNWINILDCIILNHSVGIFTYNCSDIVIYRNLFSSNLRGISLNNSYGYQIVNNQIDDIVSGGYGIFDTFSSIDRISDGFDLFSSIKNNIISSNQQMNNNYTCGIYTEYPLNSISGNYITKCSIGIWCSQSSWPNIWFNTIENNTHVGIYSNHLSYPYIVSNIISNNGNNNKISKVDIEQGGIIMKKEFKTKSAFQIEYNIITNNKGYGVYLENISNVLRFYFHYRHNVFMNDIYSNTIDAFYKDTACSWSRNYWGMDNIMVKKIEGLHTTKRGVVIPDFRFDKYPSSFPINPFIIHNNITCIIQAGLYNLADADYGFGYSVVTIYDIDRPMKIYINRYWNLTNDITFNDSFSWTLDPLYSGTLSPFQAGLFYSAPFVYSKFEIVIRNDEGVLITKRSGFQIGSFVIFNS
jgi:hypothetical protein